MQKPGVTIKILADLWHVMHPCCYEWIKSISALWRGDWCHSLFLCDMKCLLCCFALLSHDNDLHLHETLSVQSYEVCDSPSTMVMLTAFFWVIPILTSAVLSQTNDHNFMRRYIEVSFDVALLSPIVLVCVQEKQCQTSGSSLILHHYIRP